MTESGLGDQTGLEGLDRDKHALDLAAGELDPHALEVRTELALGGLYDVRADTAFGAVLTFAVDDTAFDGTFAGYFTNAGHD